MLLLLLRLGTVLLLEQLQPLLELVLVLGQVQGVLLLQGVPQLLALRLLRQGGAGLQAFCCSSWQAAR